MSKNLIILTSAAATLVASIGLAVAAEPMPPRDGHERGMHRIDSDGDGNVTRTEVLARSAAQFKDLDTNGDGKVTLEEFQVRPLEMFARSDANKDGNVSREERKAMRNEMRSQWKDKRSDTMPPRQ
jgi:EF hand